MSEITPAQKTALLKLPGFKAIRDQYAKEQKQKMAGAGKRRMKGRGFWDDVYNWFVDAGTTVNEFLKSTKLISNVASAVLPILAPMGTALLTANPLAAAASVGAAKATAEGIKALGYGSKMRGSGLLQDIANDTGLRALGKRFIAPVIAPAITSGLSAVKKMSGKGLTRQSNGLIMNQKGKGVTQDVDAIVKAIVRKPVMRGGDSRLSIVPENMRLQGKGLTRQYNGLLVQSGGKRMKGRGAGTEYGTVSSAFGEISA